MSVERQALSVSDLIAALPLGRSTIHKLINLPSFPKIKVGRRIIIPREQLKQWLHDNLGEKIGLGDD